MNYEAKINALLKKHKLGVVANPGGYEITHNNPRLPVPFQIHGIDSEDDFNTIISVLRKAGLEDHE